MRLFDDYVIRSPAADPKLHTVTITKADAEKQYALESMVKWCSRRGII